MDAKTREHLIEQSLKAKEHAYCPYSKFPVGAAVLCKDGTIFKGCNVENASYSLGVCAEKCAITKAVSEGHKHFCSIAVSSDMKDTFITPCGSCRQFLAEFGMDMDVYMTKPDKSFVKMKVRELLPLGFEPNHLEEERIARDGLIESGMVQEANLGMKGISVTSRDDVTNGVI